MTKLSEIEGIGAVYSEKLVGVGVNTSEELLAMCATPKGRKELAESSGIGDALILKWANRADLARVKGIGEEYADLLECAGVDTVPELAQRNATNLHLKLNEVNDEKSLVRQVPSESMVSDWVAKAKDLPRVLTY